jgi:hypothetical protein
VIEPSGVEGPPGLLTTLSSALLHDGRGGLTAPLETRGTRVDWGGVYGACVRLTGPWHLYLAAESPPVPLSATARSGDAVPGGYRTVHRWNDLDLVHEVYATPDPSGAVRRLTFTAPPDGDRAFHVVSDFAPFLLPVTVEGLRPLSFRATTSAHGVRLLQRGFGLDYRAAGGFDGLYVNRGSWRGGSFEGPIELFSSVHRVRVPAGATDAISWQLSGGLARMLRGPDPASDAALAHPEAVGAAVAAADRAWRDATPELRFPGAPEWERAYALAREGLRRLYCAPGDGLTGLSAGLPWYSAIWCRDVAWMLPAVLWLGDADWAARTIDSVFRFQGHSEVPILGGEAGELPMQIAPGPIFLYGTSDTTLYYPGLVARLAAHAGRSAVPTAWTLNLERILAWGRARTDPSSGLLRNGGEVASISAASASVARVRFGIEAPDTTIWDSTDRRDHAIDVQALWWDALRAIGTWLGPEDDLGKPAIALADRLAATIPARYRWAEERYAYDSWREERPVARVRPNALRAVSAGLFPTPVARELVRRASEEDLATPWGLRTLSARDPGYRPDAYHDGQVWPIATAWAADAALAAGETALGHAFVDRIARQLLERPGAAYECYRGDRAEPFDSCFLLGFSLGPFLALLFERIWGLRVLADVPELRVLPSFPPTWHAASLHRLRIGPGRTDLDWSDGRIRVRWDGPTDLRVVTRSGTLSVEPNRVAELDAPASP